MKDTNLACTPTQGCSKLQHPLSTFLTFQVCWAGQAVELSACVLLTAALLPLLIFK
jgi:hypothetical protein